MAIHNSRLLAEQRRRKILDLINAKGQITVRELVDRFNVSAVTARGDLDASAQKIWPSAHTAAQWVNWKTNHTFLTAQKTLNVLSKLLAWQESASPQYLAPPVEMPNSRPRYKRAFWLPRGNSG